jgi:hypothetical protein
MGKKISIPDYLKKYKFKIGPQISVTKGSSTPAPNVEVNTENRYYGVKGEYDIFNKKDSSLKISGSIGKGSGRADVNFPGGKQTFKGEGDMDKQFNIIFKKKFKKGGYNQGTCWDGYVQKGMKKKGNRMVPNCLPAMKTGGLTKWFNEKWVDIGSKRKDGSYAPCGRSKLASDQKRKYPKCVPAAKAARMTDSEKRSAVVRKRQAGNPGGKPTNVKTFGGK